MVSILLGLLGGLLILLALPFIFAGGYAAFLSIRRTRTGENLRHYLLHLLEQSLSS